MQKLIIPLLLVISLSLTSNAKDKADVMIRIDDIGMSHSVNHAVADIIETGLPVNISVMVPCPWFPEAVGILKDRPNVSVGLHITLTSEFKEYKWGPVADKSAVSSLLDDQGYFYPSVREFLLSDYRLEDIETEIRAQVEKALATGLKVTYVDHHMGIARATPEIAAVLEKVAAEYNLIVSRYYRETPDDLFHYSINEKGPALVQKTKDLTADKLHMFIMHPGHDHPELKALTDMNSYSMTNLETGESIMANHRSAELDALLNPEFQSAIREHNILTYDDLLKSKGKDYQVRGGIIYKNKDHSVKTAISMQENAEKTKKILDEKLNKGE